MAKKLGFLAVSSFVVSNMVGTGVFTSLGFQLDSVSNGWAVLLLWVVGGVLALCGALVYGELGSVMPRSGGEYHYLSVIYHPSLGFLSGWVSLTVGFTAPIALASMAFGEYVHHVFPFISPVVMAVGVLTLVSVLHSFTIHLGGKVQTGITFFNLCLILFFIVAGLFFSSHTPLLAEEIKKLSWHDVLAPSFAVSLIYVSYAYSGWNAAAYIAGDIERPSYVLPRALVVSTSVVMILYLLLNLVFLLTAPVNELKGQVEVGAISAQYIFGAVGGRIISLIISFLLLSSVSSMVFIGPRVTQAMGEDIRLFRVFARKSSTGVPLYALWFQYLICLLLIITSSFERVLTYAGFTLALFTFLAVMGLFVHRYRYPAVERPYKTPGYPFVPLLFLALVLWTLVYLIRERPQASLMGLCTLVAGVVVYGLNHIFAKTKK